MVCAAVDGSGFRYANTLLRDRVLFGSDFPLITPDRWLQDLQVRVLVE